MRSRKNPERRSPLLFHQPLLQAIGGDDEKEHASDITSPWVGGPNPQTAGWFDPQADTTADRYWEFVDQRLVASAPKDSRGRGSKISICSLRPSVWGSASGSGTEERSAAYSGEETGVQRRAAEP